MVCGCVHLCACAKRMSNQINTMKPPHNFLQRKKQNPVTKQYARQARHFVYIQYNNIHRKLAHADALFNLNAIHSYANIKMCKCVNAPAKNIY